MRRKLGQHFLTDRRIIQRMLATAQLTPHDRVVEIGPGNGSLTFSLARQAKQLIALEYDAELTRHLQHAFAGQAHVRILHADARAINYAELLADGEAQPVRVKIVANLPYYAAVPILFTIFHYAYVFGEGILMFQKEVAERITAAPGSKRYGALSVAAQYYSQPEYCFSIAAEAFRPRPKVESAVIKLSFLPQPQIDVLDRADFFQLVKYAFRSRRKTLKNSLTKNCAARFPLPLLNRAFEYLHFPENIRGEELSLADFAHLSNCLLQMQRS